MAGGQRKKARPRRPIQSSTLHDANECQQRGEIHRPAHAQKHDARIVKLSDIDLVFDRVPVMRGCSTRPILSRLCLARILTFQAYQIIETGNAFRDRLGSSL